MADWWLKWIGFVVGATGYQSLGNTCAQLEENVTSAALMCFSYEFQIHLFYLSCVIMLGFVINFGSIQHAVKSDEAI